MQIACPQCAMQYVLDARLLPPGGAPVQCTRCSHVFTAFPPSAPAPRPGLGLASPRLDERDRSTSAPRASASAGPGAPATGVEGTHFAQATPAFGIRVPHELMAEEPAPPGTRPPAGVVRSGASAGTPPTSSGPASTPESPAAPRPAVRTTQVFGPGAASSELKRAVPPRLATQVFGAPPAAATAGEGDREASANAGSELARPPPASPPGSTRPVELPPDLLDAEDMPEALDALREGREATRATRAGRRAGLNWMPVGAAVLLLAVAAFSWRALRARRAAVPAAAVAAREDASALLRRDDGIARSQAIDRLRALAAEHPAFLEARAELAVALALSLDDARMALARTQQARERSHREAEALRRDQIAPDWERRAAAGAEQTRALEREQEALTRSANAAAAELSAALQAMAPIAEPQEGVDPLPVLKARALAAAVQGADDALVLTERLRLSGGDGWDAVARAAYALNARAPPATVAEAAAGLDALRLRDATFLRPYVLGARLALRQGDSVQARALLDEVVALNPAHAVARQLQQELIAP